MPGRGADGRGESNAVLGGAASIATPPMTPAAAPTSCGPARELGELLRPQMADEGGSRQSAGLSTAPGGGATPIIGGDNPLGDMAVVDCGPELGV